MHPASRKYAFIAPIPVYALQTRFLKLIIYITFCHFPKNLQA